MADIDITSLRKPIDVCDVGNSRIALHYVFGTDISRRNNIILVEDHRIAYVSGNAVIFEDIVTHEKEYLMSIDEGGVGCVAIHPSRKYIAVGCKGFQPNIYIYDYPSLNIVKVLRGGAERGYSCLTFNKEGEMLASVASSPDFMLTLWSWEEEKITLHAKAFGQEVYTVRFSDYDNRRLTTSGTGHIRFWKMASTFTGKKLQGSIGKFGKVELSDVSAFVELPDGKVCSGTESGALLLWEGNFIKCRFTQPGGALCHEGEVTSVELDRENGCLITAGEDGFIRWWDFHKIDSAEVDSDHSMDFAMQPLSEYKVPESGGIRCLVHSGDVSGEKMHFVLDNSGRMSVVKVPAEEPFGVPTGSPVQLLSSGHGSAITGMDVSPTGHIAATCGIDGKIIFWDIKGRQQLGERSFEVPVVSLCWVPTNVEPSGQSVAIGFADGVFKVLRISRDPSMKESFRMTQIMAMKPHNNALTHISFSNSLPLLATGGKDGIIFFFSCKQRFVDGQLSNWTPLRFVTLAKVEEGRAPTTCTSMSWSGSCVLIGCSDGVAREVDSELVVASANEDAETFEAKFKLREITVKARTMVASNSAAAIDTEANENEEKAVAASDGKSSPEYNFVPAKINKCVYSFAHNNTRHDRYFASVSIGQSHMLQECVFRNETPLRDLHIGLYSHDGKEFRKYPAINVMGYSSSRDFILVGASDGSVVVKPTNFVETFVSTIGHNSACGGVSAIALTSDNEYVVSAGYDGLLVVNRLNCGKLIEAAKPLSLDVEAGVYAGQKSKEISRKIPEPKYMHKLLQSETPEGFDPVFPGGYDAELNLDESIKALPPDEEVDDIEPGAYSIEDAKLKKEEDNKKSAAEIKKDKIRQIVVKLRKEFDELRYHNEQLPDVIRLESDELLVDAAYFKLLEKEGKAMVEEVHKECEYVAEKALVLRNKIHKRLMTDIIVEEMPLYGLRQKKPPKVLSLRTVGLNPDKEKALREVHKSIRKEEEEISKARVDAAIASELDTSEGGESASLLLRNLQSKADSATHTLSKTAEGGKGGTLHATSGRREMRAKRIEALKKHEAEKPKEHEDDPRDIYAIQHAEKTIGSFNLKSADNYEVPEDQIINAEKKRRQMIMLEESMIALRLRFNERFLSMRNLKKEIVEVIDSNNKRIREIDMELHTDVSSVWDPKLQVEEFADDRDELTEKELDSFIAARKKTEWKKVVAPPPQIFTGSKTVLETDILTGDLNVCPRRVESNDEVLLSDEHIDENNMINGNRDKSVESKPCKRDGEIDDSIISFHMSDKLGTKFMSLEQCIPSLMHARHHLNQIRASDTTKQTISPEEKRIANEYRRSLLFEKQFLMKKNEDHIAAFDSNLEDLRLERHALAGDLKLAELKLLTLYQEYQLLLTFEERDSALRQKEERCKREKQDIQSNSGDIQSKLDSKLDDQSVWNEKMSNLTGEFKSLVPESNPYCEILTKIFKKKIKRSKGGDDMDDEDDEEEEDDDDDDDYDDDEIEDVCPPGCDVTLYDHVLEFREKRLDIEEVLTEIQKVIDDLKKSKDRLKQREKQIDKDAKSTELEIQNFQRQKQAALNKIEVFVPLRISQLHTFTTSGVISGPDDDEAALAQLRSDPDFISDESTLRDPNKRQMVQDMDLTSHTVFKNSALQRLSARIGELREEIVEAKVNFKALHKEKVRLEKERGAQRKKIESWTDKCNELQMLKFGRLIDLDVLEQGSDRTKEEEAEDAIAQMERAHQKEMAKLAAELEELKQKFAETTAVNTAHLENMGELAGRKLEIAREMNVPGEALAQDPQLSDYKDSIERDKLATFVKLQYREIESLKSEITMLRRKETAQFAAFLPQAPPPPTSPPASTRSKNLTLPPIPNVDRRGGSPP